MEEELSFSAPSMGGQAFTMPGGGTLGEPPPEKLHES